jgi:hypothetical protein
MDREVELVFGGRCGVGAARMIIYSEIALALTG